jgi:RecA-family ATPase
MSIYEQAQRYLDAIPSAVSGAAGHNQTLSAAMALVEGFGLSAAEARPLMVAYSQRCDPPWSDREIDHKLSEAEKLCDPSKRGSKVKRGVKYQSNHRSPPASARAVVAAPRGAAAAITAKGVRYEVSDAIELPKPIADGTRAFIKAAFSEGEGIRIAIARTNDDDKREVPKDAGITLSREEWLRKLDSASGNPNKFLKTSERNGIFVSVNPMRIGGSKDADVTAYRHALLEFDNISLEEQWGIIIASKIPCAAVISSGGKSIHAWVKVDAKDRQEFSDRVKVLYQHFAEYQPDEKNKNPSRFSRLPNCERGSKRQELLAIDIGCESFAEWLTLNEVDSLGASITPADLEAFDSSKDEKNLIGLRYVGRGMGCLLVGPSGVGKSSLNLQMAICWGVGHSSFGIAPVKPLKSLIIQAENDTGDLSEMFKGVCQGLGIKLLSENWDLLQSNLVFVRDTSHTGLAFCQTVQRLIERHKPDLVWLDPILSFVGADLSRQEVIGQFFRNWLNPILDATGVACFCIHHTGKPPSDKGARQHWQTSDYAYAGLGSSDLTNWARAVMVLQDRGHGCFELKLAKRGKRAGVITIDGAPTTSLWLKHSSNPNQIFWEQCDAPVEPEKSERKGGKPDDKARIAAMNLHEFISGCKADGEGLNTISKRLESWLAKQGEDLSLRTCQRIIPLLVKNKKLTKGSDTLYRKGSEA